MEKEDEKDYHEGHEPQFGCEGHHGCEKVRESYVRQTFEINIDKECGLT